VEISDVFEFRRETRVVHHGSEEGDDVSEPNDGYVSDSDEDGDYTEAHAMEVWEPSELATRT
jgi:hypothetical protein